MGDNVSRDPSTNQIAESLVDKLPETNDPVTRMLIEMIRKQDEVGRKQDEIREEVANIGQRQEEACKRQEEMVRSITPKLDEEDIVIILCEHFDKNIQDARRVQNVVTIKDFEKLLDREDIDERQ
ncbi:hypothetical protein J6590_092147 [Homalodisca vitripennis]|nr:hypothetical protein J6590_092147 [Homalodisca vitripennis]